MSTPARLGPLASELQAALALVPPPSVGLPAPTPTLRSLAATAGLQVQTLAARLGYNPRLFANVDARLQVLPAPAAFRMAQAIDRPVADVIWAAGGKLLTAPAPGLGRRPL